MVTLLWRLVSQVECMTSRWGNYHAILYRDCVDRMAETAGCHFFKCPLCNNRQQFSEEMKQFGELYSMCCVVI